MYSDENQRTNIMKRTILFITSLLLIVGCSKEYNIDDLIKDTSTDNIEIFSEKYSNNVVSGKLYQIYKNQKVILGKIKNGKKEGIWNYWYDDGRKKSEGTYKDGKKEGEWTDWYENGQKWTEVTYKDGKKEGLSILWYENGQKYSETTYKNEKIISSKGWYENGTEFIPINDKTFFTKSNHWKVKDFYWTSSQENIEKLLSSKDGTFLENDTLHLIKDYNFDEVPDESKIFKGMKIYFSDSLVNLKIDGYDNDDIKFPYNYRVLTREFEIDFSILDEKLNNLTLRMSKYITYNTIRLDWDYFVEDMKLNYSVILSRVE